MNCHFYGRKRNEFYFVFSRVKVNGYNLINGRQIPADGRLYYQGINVQDIISGLKGRRFGFEETIYLLILKLLYDEHMAEASSNTSVYTSLGEIHEKINDFHLMRTLPSITEMRRSIALLKKYQIIEPLDVLEELNEETRMMIYPCVNVVLLGDDIRRLIESFSKEEVDSEFDEDEAAISGIIEDMPE